MIIYDNVGTLPWNGIEEKHALSISTLNCAKLNWYLVVNVKLNLGLQSTSFSRVDRVRPDEM